MVSVNRMAIVVKPGQPFLDWLHQVDPPSKELNLEDLWEEPSVYLVPECDNEKEIRKCLKEICGQIFEEQLDSWITEPSAWPKRRDLEAFDDWFEWSFHSLVFDLSVEPVLHEEM
jgi:hypothetical protein